MDKFVYIKNSVPGYYVDFPDELDKEMFADDIGYTYQDFLDNKFVLLSDEQVNFYIKNPDATVEEVFNTEFNTEIHIKTLEEVKEDKLLEISNYDISPAVNSFTINGEITTWFTKTDRVSYKNSIDSAKLLGVNELSLFVNGILMTIPTQTAERLLAAIQLYADACYIVTQQHINIINNMTEIEDIDNYDYTVGYPERLNFTI